MSMNNKQALGRIVGALFFALMGLAAWGYEASTPQNGVGLFGYFALGVVMFVIAAGIGRPVWNRRR